MKQTALAAMTSSMLPCIQEYLPVNILCKVLDMVGPAARPAGFMRGGSYKMSVWHRVGMVNPLPQAGDVGHVNHQICRNTVGNLTESLKIRIRE